MNPANVARLNDLKEQRTMSRPTLRRFRADAAFSWAAAFAGLPAGPVGFRPGAVSLSSSPVHLHTVGGGPMDGSQSVDHRAGGGARSQ